MLYVAVYCTVCAHKIAKFSYVKEIEELGETGNTFYKDLDISKETMVVGKVLSEVTEDNSGV